MTAVATRRTAWLLLVAALVLGVCARCPKTWERTEDRPSRPVVAAPVRVHVLDPGAAMGARVLVETRGGVRP